MLLPLDYLLKKYRFKPTGVIHLGANVAEEAKAYNDAGIEKVIWVEANKDLFQTLLKNLEPYPNQVPFMALIGSQNGIEVDFHISNNSGQSSSVLELGTHKKQHPSVHYVSSEKRTTIRVDRLLEDINTSDYNFLNIDLQGYEMEALRGMGNLMDNIKWAYIEINKAEVYRGCPHVNDIDLFLNGFGFKRVETAKWIGDWTDALYIKK